MEELATAIIDGTNLIKLSLANASAAEDYKVDIDQESLMDWYM